MRIKILYLGVVKNKAGKKEEEYQIKDGSSLSHLLKNLAETRGLKDIFNADMTTFFVTWSTHVCHDDKTASPFHNIIQSA